MKDPIERMDAIGAVLKHYRAHDNDLLELIAFDIERLPSAQSEPQWISCSERLPEIDELVLVTDDSGGVKTVDVDRCGQYECSEKRFGITHKMLSHGCRYRNRMWKGGKNNGRI